MASTPQPRFLMVETSDSRKFHIPMALMSSAAAIRALFDETDMTADAWDEGECWSDASGPAEPCVLPEVQARVFERVLRWCAAHRDSEGSDSIDSKAFERRFLDLPPSDLVELISAAQYLGIERLFSEATRQLNQRNA